MSFQHLHPNFAQITGPNPEIKCHIENNDYPFAHEASVYIPLKDQVFVTSNRIETDNGKQRIQISKIQLNDNDACIKEEIHPDIPMANGGVNYLEGVLFCSQGTLDRPSSLIHMEIEAPYKCTTVIDSFYGRKFNSLNDVVIHSDGSIWFTDPVYGFKQGYRPVPELPAQVYRYDWLTKSVRVVADGFGRPNGISFSPDEKTVYITDTDAVQGDGSVKLALAATIYAFDVVEYHQQPFLTNRRVFAMSDNGIPDGIKCDLEGNVYSGCGDGIHVWSPGGVLLGKILIPGGVANFCFEKPGKILALNETRFWRISLTPSCRGALLGL
ncbi:hypothetical protein N7466_007860 [Penicillium verhagenii]|uniref:uncharacterized protein n=1 Tax=Penicillium verhagenii TaxID=1562060 RepID=UPI002545291E|nr:uncharacterized protein N7466_007860 [Penicillium verhagenii]KAJ5928904.1 hypothetical protein N7466_007860 [Penicillium verhagenii]